MNKNLSATTMKVYRSKPFDLSVRTPEDSATLMPYFTSGNERCAVPKTATFQKLLNQPNKHQLHVLPIESCEPTSCIFWPPVARVPRSAGILPFGKPILKSVRNTTKFLTDWSHAMERLTARILEEARQRPEGASISAKALLHLGNRDAVDQTLSRLVTRGALLRVGRGLYVLPIKGKFGVRAPSTRALLEQIGEQTGETIVSSGAVAASRLGLTTQVPTQEVYLTSGRSREMRLGKRVVTLRHAKAWELSLAKRVAGEAIRALGALGPLKIQNALVKLRQTLPPEEFRALTLAAGQVPTWMAEHLSKHHSSR